MWAPHNDELLSADALRAAYRLGERFVFSDGGEVVDVRTYEEHDFSAVADLSLLGQSSRSEVCAFMSWFRSDWITPDKGEHEWSADDATTLEFWPGDEHGFDDEGATYVQASALLYLRKHAYAMANLVEVGGGDS